MKLDGLSLLHAWLRPAEVQGLVQGVQGQKQNLGGLMMSGKKPHKQLKGVMGAVGGPTDVRGNLTGPPGKDLTGTVKQLIRRRRLILDSVTGNMTNVAIGDGTDTSHSTGGGVTGGVTASGGGSSMIPIAQLSDHYNTRIFLWHKDTEHTPVDAR